MNNEKILKKKIQQYLLMPLALTVLLVGMVIVLYVHDKKSGAIAAAAVFIFVVCEIIFFIVMKAAIMPVVFRFALEQGQIQKELLKELDIPYALLDTDGKILWGNAKFIEEIATFSLSSLLALLFCFKLLLQYKVLSLTCQVTVYFAFGFDYHLPILKWEDREYGDQQKSIYLTFVR